MAERDLQRVAREVFLGTFLGGRLGEQSWALTRMASLLHDVHLAEGEILFREGDPADRIFLFDQAGVRMTREGMPPWTYLGRWILGAVDVIADRPRSRTATALSAFSGASMLARDWIELLEDTFEVTHSAVRDQARAVATLYARASENVPAVEPVIEPAAKNETPSAKSMQRLSLLERMQLLFDCPALAQACVQTLSVLAESSREVPLAPEQPLFEAETTRSKVHVVAHGEISCASARHGRTSIVEGAAAWAGGPTLTAAYATTEAVVLEIEVDDWFDAMEDHGDLLRSTLAFISLERERLLDTLAARDGELVLR